MSETDAMSAIRRAVRTLLQDIDAGVAWPQFGLATVPGYDDPRRITDPVANAVWNLADQVADAVGHGFGAVDHGIPVSEAVEMLRQVVDEPNWTLDSMDPRIAQFRWP